MYPNNCLVVGLLCFVLFFVSLAVANIVQNEKNLYTSYPFFDIFSTVLSVSGIGA